MRQRVRALLTEPTGRIVTYRRIRSDRPPYWVLPGGHAEPDDTSLTSALHRELWEELGGHARIDKLVHVTREGPDHFQYFYTGRIETWSLADRTGEEFDDPGMGEYHLELIEPDAEAIAAINLRPEPFSLWLTQRLRDGERPADLPEVAPPTGVPRTVVR